MIDLTQIDDDTLMARGGYSTVRAAHEDQKKNLQALCGLLASVPSKVLRQMQPDDDAVPESVADLLATGRRAIDDMELCVESIRSLAKQKAAIKTQAWGRK